jgi:hypothetical protein
MHIPFGIFKLFYSFRLFLLAMVMSVHWFMTFDFPPLVSSNFSKPINNQCKWLSG